MWFDEFFPTNIFPWILHYVIWSIFSYEYISMNFALCDLINFFLRIYFHEFCTTWFDQFFPTNIFPWILHYLIWSFFSYKYIPMNFALREILFSLGPSAVLFYYPSEGVWVIVPHSLTPRGLPTVPPSQCIVMQVCA